MARFGPVGGLLILALLALPSAMAAPVQGRLTVEGQLLLTGPVTLTAAGADLRWEAEGLPDVVIEADAIRVERYGTSHRYQELPVTQGIALSADRVDQRVDHGASQIVLEGGEGINLLVVSATGELAASLPDAQVRPVLGASLFRGLRATDAWSCETELCRDVFGVYEVTGGASTGTLNGTLTLFLRGPRLLVSDEEGRTEYASGRTTSSTGTLTTIEDTWIVATAQNARARIEGGADAQWYAERPRLDAAGLAAEGSGALDVGATTYRAQGEPIEAVGALTILPLDLPAPALDLASRPLVYGDAFTTEVEGDVAAINLRAAPLFAQSTAQQAGLLAVGGAALAALLYYWPHVAFHATSAAIPLYSRLKRPDLLENDVRNAIYDIIRSSPGISARAVQRQSELSWGTVVYHLRQLERHHLVVSRTLGRTRNYYENHGKYKGMEVPLACLQSSRALALARLIVQEPGTTQEALSAASGLPQPTTSYYVRKLRQANLVEERREGRFTRYAPAPELARYLAFADARPPAAALP